MAGPVLRRLDLVRTQIRSSERCQGIGSLVLFNSRFSLRCSLSGLPVPTLTAHSEQWHVVFVSTDPNHKSRKSPLTLYCVQCKLVLHPECSGLKCFGFFGLMEYLHRHNIVGMDFGLGMKFMYLLPTASIFLILHFKSCA